MKTSNECRIESVFNRFTVAAGDGRAVRLGFIEPNDNLGGTASHQRASFSDPVAESVDPTSPFGPEQTRDWQKPDAPARTWTLPLQGGFKTKHRRGTR